MNNRRKSAEYSIGDPSLREAKLERYVNGDFVTCSDCGYHVCSCPAKAADTDPITWWAQYKNSPQAALPWQANAGPDCGCPSCYWRARWGKK